MGPEPEYCCCCGDPTEKAGRGDGSIYVEATATIPLGQHPESAAVYPGEELGPLCDRCYDRLTELDWIKTDE